MERINTFKLPDFAIEQDLCIKLLNSVDPLTKNKKYIEQLQSISNRESEVLSLSLDEAASVISRDFALRIECNVLRYISLFYNAADRVMPPPSKPILNKTRADVFLTSRLKMIELNKNEPNEANGLPKDLSRRYEVVVLPFKSSKPLTVREVKSDQIGRLITVSGIAIRVTNVRPLLFVAAYTCDACGHEFYKSIRSKEFMPMVFCENKNCVSSENIHLQTRGSRFLKYQQLTIQETPETVPYGSMPRAMTINLRSSFVRKCVAGDFITVAGVVLPTQYFGFRQMKAGLTSSTVFEGLHLARDEKSATDKEPSEAELEKAREMAADPDCFSVLARSIAPEIYGLLDVKKALLLLMVGGATKVMADGLKIRGDINVLVMGDPGVAKSQLLKHISFIAPRAVYTTGKGSSGVGLTAAVVRDPVTDEMVLEGGALVMADMGVCCIDEFDKMEEGDRTAIHEVMEQQTVSIAKAGICTTLNARTAVLAAANPVFGRYDVKKSPEANIVLPAALMSRFDLLFVLVDQPSPQTDGDLAEHICYVHQHKKPPELGFDPVSPAFLRTYISIAKKIDPVVSDQVFDKIVELYLQMRAEGRANDAHRLLPTPRALLSILRISQAHARLRLSATIAEDDVTEATRLLYASQASTREGDAGKKEVLDRASAVFAHVKGYLSSRKARSAKISDLLESLKLRGFSLDSVNGALDHYARLDVWMVNRARTKLSLL